MPKKEWTEAERQAFGEKMKAARLAKQAEEAQKQKPLENKIPEDIKEQIVEDSYRPPHKSILSAEAVEKLLQRMDQLETELQASNKARRIESVQEKQSEFSVKDTGEATGILTKYPLSKAYYPDPTPELQKEPFLSRFAFKENYILKWDVEGMVYETKWGTTVAEPKFTLVLYRRMYDDNGEPTGKLIRITSLNIFEDPASVRQLIVDLDIDTEGFSEQEIFDLIRYHRIKEWLKGVFQPPINLRDTHKSSETVIDGRVVVIEEEAKVLSD